VNISGIDSLRGALYQAPQATSNGTLLGDLIISSVPLSTDTGEVMYIAPNSGDTDKFNLSCSCDGLIETGYVHIVLMSNPSASNDISVAVIVNIASEIYLSGSNDINGLMRATVISLPEKGQLSQYDFNQPNETIPITEVPTKLINPFNIVVYTPNLNEKGVDSFNFMLTFFNLTSVVATAKIDVLAWENTPPIVEKFVNINLFNRQKQLLQYKVIDLATDKYVGGYITRLPTKGPSFECNTVIILLKLIISIRQFISGV
jgi:hypothetical protein